MINWPNWPLGRVEEEEIKLISENHQDLEGIPIMVGGEKLLFGTRKT
jgi:hypothetical protein